MAHGDPLWELLCAGQVRDRSHIHKDSVLVRGTLDLTDVVLAAASGGPAPLVTTMEAAGGRVAREQWVVLGTGGRGDVRTQPKVLLAVAWTRTGRSCWAGRCSMHDRVQSRAQIPHLPLLLHQRSQVLTGACCICLGVRGFCGHCTQSPRCCPWSSQCPAHFVCLCCGPGHWL